MRIVLAGGSGLVGTRLEKLLVDAGHKVKILSRRPSKVNHVHWNPKEGEVALEEILDTEVIVNLCGAGIADKNWTTNRKRELLQSRVDPIHFLHRISDKIPHLKHFITASGITCYGFDESKELYEEEAPFGDDFISQLVQKWELASDVFSDKYILTKLRISIVISEQGGAIEKMRKPMNYGLGAALGTGRQIIPWIHIDDLCNFVAFVLENQISGVYNVAAGNTNNLELTKALANEDKKKLWLPNVPSFMVKLMFGKLSEILLKGVSVSNLKMKSTGFKFSKERLPEALKK